MIWTTCSLGMQFVPSSWTIRSLELQFVPSNWTTHYLGLQFVPSNWWMLESRERIAIRDNGLLKSREQIAIRENELSNSRERITNPWDRNVQFDIKIYLCVCFFLKISMSLQGSRIDLFKHMIIKFVYKFRSQSLTIGGFPKTNDFNILRCLLNFLQLLSLKDNFVECILHLYNAYKHCNLITRRNNIYELTCRYLNMHLVRLYSSLTTSKREQEAHGPHRSLEKPVQINEHIRGKFWLYIL